MRAARVDLPGARRGRLRSVERTRERRRSTEGKVRQRQDTLAKSGFSPGRFKRERDLVLNPYEVPTSPPRSLEDQKMKELEYVGKEWFDRLKRLQNMVQVRLSSWQAELGNGTEPAPAAMETGNDGEHGET